MMFGDIQDVYIPRHSSSYSSSCNNINNTRTEDEGRLDDILNEAESVLERTRLFPFPPPCGGNNGDDMAALLEPTPIFERRGHFCDNNTMVNVVDHIKLSALSPFASSNRILQDESTTTEFLKLFSNTTPEEVHEDDSYTDIMPLEWITLPTVSPPTNQMTHTVSTASLDGVFSNLSSPSRATITTPPRRVSSSSSNTTDKKSSSSLHSPVKIGQWMERVKELLHFREEFGHCLVPHNWSKNRKLAQWVKRQRYQYRLLCQGRHSTLSLDRVAQLEDIGFVWNSHKACWDDKFQQLVEFKHKYGHCNVPSTWVKNPSLAIWVKFQRRQYKVNYGKNINSHNSGDSIIDCDDAANGHNTLTEERVQRLLSLGFSFDPRNTLLRS